MGQESAGAALDRPLDASLSPADARDPQQQQHGCEQGICTVPQQVRRLALRPVALHGFLDSIEIDLGQRIAIDALRQGIHVVHGGDAIGPGLDERVTFLPGDPQLVERPALVTSECPQSFADAKRALVSGIAGDADHAEQVVPVQHNHGRGPSLLDGPDVRGGLGRRRCSVARRSAGICGKPGA